MIKGLPFISSRICFACCAISSWLPFTRTPVLSGNPPKITLSGNRLLPSARESPLICTPQLTIIGFSFTYRLKSIPLLQIWSTSNKKRLYILYRKLYRNMPDYIEFYGVTVLELKPREMQKTL